MINIKNLHKHFGKLEVLKGIDLEIASGEVVVVIGPSGSEKVLLTLPELIRTTNNRYDSFRKQRPNGETNQRQRTSSKNGHGFPKLQLVST